MKGSQWTLAAYAVRTGFAFVTAAILARILGPSAFGIFALATALAGIAYVIGDLGLGATLIARQDLDAHSQQAIHAVLIVMALGLGAVTFVVSATLYFVGIEQLPGVLAALGLVLGLSGTSWFVVALQRRRLRFKLQFVCAAVQSVAVSSVSVVSALEGLGVYAFAAGQLAGVVALTGTQLLVTRQVPRPVSSPSEMRRVAMLGRGFFAQGLFGFAAQNVDNVVVASTAGNAALGLYSVSYRLAALPYTAVTEPVAQSMFPQLSKRRADGEPMIPGFLQSLALVSLLSGPVVGLFVGAPGLVLVTIYGSRWSGAEDALFFLGIWALIRPTQGLVGWALNAAGASGVMAKVAAWTLLGSVPTLLGASLVAGITGVAVVMVLDIALSAGILLFLLRRYVSEPQRRVYELFAIHVAATLSAACGAYAVPRLLGAEGSFLVLSLAALAAALAYLGFIALVRPREFVGVIEPVADRLLVRKRSRGEVINRRER